MWNGDFPTTVNVRARRPAQPLNDGGGGEVQPGLGPVRVTWQVQRRLPPKVNRGGGKDGMEVDELHAIRRERRLIAAALFGATTTTRRPPLAAS